MSNELTPGDPLWTGRPDSPGQPAHERVPAPVPPAGPPPSKRKLGWKSWCGLAIVALLIIGAAGNAVEEEPAPSARESSANAASSGGASTQPASTATPVATPTPEPTVTVRVSTPSDGKTIRRPRVTIKGTVEPRNARVKVAGHRVKVRGGRFKRSVSLDVGQNLLSIQASLGDERDEVTRELTRKRSAREMAALRARRAAARAAKRQSYINGTQTIPYNQLQKSADRYAGKRVAYYGQIFQIQEDPGGGGMMLLSVTDEGYGFWSNEIWVNYEGRVRGAEGDTLTVYGKVVGSRDFETQIGGSRYVPEVDAKYIVE